MSRPEDVLHFWLGNPGDPPLRNAPQWWKKDATFDSECRSRFGGLIDAGHVNRSNFDRILLRKEC